MVSRLSTPDPNADLRASIEAVSRIEAVPRILEVLCRSTGMGFAAVARVTEERWIACCVRDEINFGLEAGGELKVETTLCHEIRQRREMIVIEDVARDPTYCTHHTPAMYGLQSYVSIPIIREDGSFFGTLCAVHPHPAAVNNPATIGMFKLFAELIGMHLDVVDRLGSSEARLAEERKSAESREQFIAVLGHDLRSPLSAIANNADVLLRLPVNETARQVAQRIKNSSRRMSGLIEEVLDFARGRLGSGLTLAINDEVEIASVLRNVLSEVQASSPQRAILVEIEVDRTFRGEASRLGQLFSNLLNNAITHGSAELPIRVRASTSEDEFTLSVANAGDPIPPVAIDRLFQPFFRADTRESREGLGLGLYIASEIARAHGGTLDVASTADETCFTFRMPLA